ncbi:HWE histidine kinase domain-containing protein [Ancylobacter polymorphus]|uniref:histidine kinase n=1 Tax=Ancylobacter polymorphus TaxID=223390 RepID=A0ABU0BBT0_9HYPH|nr:HWE histidine kinase domain-containing protein [Ancylobacter polymorphus]MDQ0303286.1 light-regulated signal transduction histidine kinase (bacteriophytochrome)/CheY-like chemotaxis protein [Ancylobacter polymorphus]
MSVGERVDLSNCDREPIHIPGSVQCHGCLIACDPQGGVVQRHSSNAAEMLALSGPLIGRDLADLLGSRAATRIREALARGSDPSSPALLFNVELASGGRFDVSAHVFRGVSLIEFEVASAEDGPALDLARSMFARVRGEKDIDRLLEHSSRLIRSLLGYDRVMIYQFAEDGAGQVVSEDRREDLESFLHQWFPASDIPQQARSLYVRNIVRVIGDANGERCPLVPEETPLDDPLDLSFAHLRSVSPIHLEYLRNMGVAASMSISVIVDGQLWGLVACHHYAPRVLPMAERVAAEMFGAFFALHLQALKQKRTLDVATMARRALDRVLGLASQEEDIGGLLRTNLADFAKLMPCDGIGLWLGGQWSADGAVPPASDIPGLANFIGERAEGKVWASHELSAIWPRAETFCAEASGVLALPLSQLPRDYLLFFRKEIVHTLDWAGRPEKTYETGPLGDRLTPRKSFAIWKETVRGKASPWTDADREIAEAARSTLVEIVLRHNELMADERDKADTRQRLLNEELNHRVKNILAVIKSLVEHSLRDGRSTQDYVESLRGRVQALAIAHDQVVRGAGGGSLGDLLRAELSPYGGDGSRLTLSGPTVWLDARAFSVMALVLHELSTNAAKYGALSRLGGRLEVAWRVTPEGDCEVMWREQGGPEVVATGRRGFGMALIERSVPYDLGGTSRLEFAPAGLVAHLRLPARHISTSSGEAGEGLEGDNLGAAPAQPEPLSELGVLLVEDQMLIAMDVEMMLNDAGIDNVVTAPSAAEALRRLQDFTPDVAVLDVNLGAGTSAPVAQELQRLGVPFLFATGYGDRSMIPAGCEGVPVLPKPYESEPLMKALREIWERRAA